MAFPCPICGGVAKTRSSRMLSATTKETYYNCSNDNCCHQFRTLEGDPVTLAMPIPGGQAIPFEVIRNMKISPRKVAQKKKQGTSNTKESHQEKIKPGNQSATSIKLVEPGRIVHLIAG